jgi:flagellar biosynthetic protein FlhB
MANDRTEKATPKKRSEERKKGQVAKSPDVNGAVVMMAAVIALSAFGPKMFQRMEEAMIGILGLVKTPDVVGSDGMADLFIGAGAHAFAGAAPIVFVCMIAGIVAIFGKVGFKPSA